MRGLSKYLVLMGAVVLLIGCSPHETRMDEAEIRMPARFLQAEIASPSSLGPWWEAFGDPGLNSLMEEALQHNLDVRQALARLAQFEALKKQSAAGLFPSLGLGAKASRDQSQGLGGENTGSSQSLSLAAGYELDLWQRIRATAGAADFLARASREDLKALYMNLTAQVADLYFLGVEQRAQLQLTDSIIGTLEDRLRRVENRYRQGLAGALDVYQARQNLLEAREALPTIASSLAVAEHGLSVLLGRFPEENLGGSLRELAEAPEAFPAGLPATLLASRPDIEAARLRLASRDAEVAAAVAARFPTLNLLGGYGVTRIDQGLAIASGTFWSLAAELSQSLFDAGARKAEVDRRQAAFAEQLAAWRQAVLNAVREVEDALARNRARELQLQALKERGEAAAAALRLATGDYFEGLSDYLPVLVAQQLHFQIQRTLLSSKRQLLSDRIGLARALGGSWPEATLIEQLPQAGEEKFPSNQGYDNEQQ